MTWHPPVPRRVTDAAGTAWTVQRAWPGTSPGSYVVEVRSPDRPGVLAGTFNDGAFKAVTVDDPRLPALAAESPRGEVVVHRAHKRAVVRAPEAFIKVFRPGRALAAAASHSIAAAEEAVRAPAGAAAGAPAGGPKTALLAEGYLDAGGRFSQSAVDAWAAYRLFNSSVDPFRDRSPEWAADMSWHLGRAKELIP